MTVANIEQISAFGKDNVEALVQSSTLAAQGLEELAKAYSALANSSIEQTTSAIKTLAAVKNPAEFGTIYGNLAKQSYESFVAESRKIQALANSVLTTSFAPLNARIQAVSSLFQKAA